MMNKTFPDLYPQLEYVIVKYKERKEYSNRIKKSLKSCVS